MLIRILFLSIFTQAALAAPWMTGPLLAGSGRTTPAGHFGFEPYAFYTIYPDRYRNLEALPNLSIGLTDHLDVLTSIPYDYSWNRDRHGNDFGDYSLALGVQVLKQSENTWYPDIRFVIQEIFPTGKFDHLDMTKLGTDQTGYGAYQTFLVLNFQKLTELKNEHYLRTRLGLISVKASDVTVHGANAFGGGLMTKGKLHGGISYAVDLAFEYSLTQHWVPVIEALYSKNTDLAFSGNPGFTPGGSIAGIGSPGGHSASLAPALEYNFSQNLGIIGGVWFSLTGPHAATFTSYAIAISYYC